MALHPEKVLASRFVQRLLRRKSGQLVRSPALRHTDRDDIEQQLALELLRRLPRYRRSSAHPKAFIVTVVERQAATILRHARAQKRDAGLVESLSQDVTGDDGLPTALSATLSPDDGQRRRGNYQLAPLDHVQIATDLAEFLTKLPADMAWLARELMQRGPSDIARRRGIARSTLQDSIDRLRELFAQAGFHLTVNRRKCARREKNSVRNRMTHSSR
jgi:RNA polymerase sigma-70 factor (ECF subfamily)